MAIDQAATDAFKNNPLGFLAGAMILPPTQNALRRNRSEHLGLARLGNGEPVTGTWAARLNAGGVIPLYQVKKAGEGEPYFRSYIADYAQGDTTATTLGTNQHARFCFTANMNGCTFGVGGQAGPGDALIVTHGNMANVYGKTNIQPQLQPGTKAMLQVALQHGSARDALGGQGGVFEPESYRVGQKMAVTFGIRTPGQKWAFYFISYERTGTGMAPVYVSYGVNPITLNQFNA